MPGLGAASPDSIRRNEGQAQAGQSLKGLVAQPRMARESLALGRDPKSPLALPPPEELKGWGPPLDL